MTPDATIQRFPRWLRRSFMVVALPYAMIAPPFYRTRQAARMWWLDCRADWSEEWRDAKRWWR